MNIGGVYEIQNTVNGKRYIGSTVSFEKRFARHERELNQGAHHNQHLLNAWQLHGGKAFAFTPVMLCGPSEMHAWEQRYIDAVAPEYNIARTVLQPMLGRHHTPQAKALLRLRNTGQKRSPEMCAVTGMHSRGRVLSPETRAKMSAARTGKKRGPLSDEHKAKLSAARKGTHLSSERRAQMVIESTCRVHSAETRAKISDRKKGVRRAPFSAEWRARLSAAGKAYNARRRLRL